MVSGGMTCVKYLLFVFNLLFVISGIAIIAVGAYALNIHSDYHTFVDEKFNIGPLMLIVVGSVIFIIAFFGCCGAVRENHCMVITFSVLLLTIFCIELAGGICGYVFREDVTNGVKKQVEETIDQFNSNAGVAHSWNVMQHDLKCCGVDSPRDWLKNATISHSIPVSCCKGMEEGGNCTENLAYKTGCVQALKETVEHYALIIGGVAIGIALIQLFGVLFACCLAKSIRKEYQTV